MVLTICRYPSETTRDITDAAYLYESTTFVCTVGSISRNPAQTACAAERWPAPTLAERNRTRIRAFLRLLLRSLRQRRESRRESLAPALHRRPGSPRGRSR